MDTFYKITHFFYVPVPYIYILTVSIIIKYILNNVVLTNHSYRRDANSVVEELGRRVASLLAWL